MKRKINHFKHVIAIVMIVLLTTTSVDMSGFWGMEKVYAATTYTIVNVRKSLREQYQYTDEIFYNTDDGLNGTYYYNKSNTVENGVTYYAGDIFKNTSTVIASHLYIYKEPIKEEDVPNDAVHNNRIKDVMIVKNNGKKTLEETYTSNAGEAVSAPDGWYIFAYVDRGGAGTCLLLCPVHVCKSSTLTKTAAKAPTCTKDGNVEYYTCTCGKTYSDSEAKKEITVVKRPATGHSWKYIQDINSKNTIKARCNNDGCTYKDSDNLTLSINAKDAAYTGNAYSNVKVTDNLTSVTNASKGTVTYYATDSDGNKTGTSITAPVNKGNYVAELTITDTSGQKYTVQDTFAIDKADQSATVSMADYNFDETVSIPTISGQKGTTEVTYYYNTTNSNENGTEWKDISGDTLEPGTYYMYAVIPETENYRAYTTPTTAFKVIGKEMTGIVANSVDTTYDKEEHSISVSGYPDEATVRYGTEAGTYDLTESPEFVDAGTYTVYFKITARGYNPYIGQTTVTIQPKEVELVWSNTEFTYDGTVQTPLATVVENSLCAGDSCTVTVTGGQKDYSASAYTAKASSLSNTNYKLPDNVTQEFTIAQKEIGVNWSNIELTYNRAVQTPTANLDGVCSGDTCTVTVGGGQTNVGENYKATATLNNNNYTLAETDKEVTYKIVPKPITKDMIGLDGANHQYTYTGTTITPVVTIKDGDSVTLEQGEDKDYVVSGTTSAESFGAYELIVTGKGNYTGEVKVGWKIADSNPPTGTITIKDDSWTAFWNGVTFGKFFKETQTVTITAEDPADENGAAASGIDKMYYYKSSEILTYDAIAALPEGTWTEYKDSFSIDPDAKLVIYAKITDKSGNVSYISTEGLVLDKTAPAITGVTDKMKYCGAKTITVKDVNLSKVTVNGEDVTLTDDTYQLSTTEDTGKEFTIVATDKAGNSTTVTVTIYKDHNWPAEWTSVKEATATKEGKEEKVCTNCKQKKVRTIPVTGSTEDTTNGNLTKDAEVAPDAPIEVASLNNKKSDILDATSIFTPAEKAQITNGDDARVWLEVTKTDENKITPSDQTKITEAAEDIMGSDPDITYFDADLFKKVGDTGNKEKISEPGIDIEVTIKIPDELLRHDRSMIREYQIIRLHAGNVDIIRDGTFDESTNEFTFKTDKFSTYAIAYKDTQRYPGGNPGSGTSPSGAGSSSGGGGSYYYPVTGITVTPDKATLTKAGETLQLTANVSPSYATNKNVTWTSDNEAVVTVDSTGKVTAVGNGTATITATTQSGSKTATIVITVNIQNETSEIEHPVISAEPVLPQISATPTEPARPIPPVVTEVPKQSPEATMQPSVTTAIPSTKQPVSTLKPPATPKPVAKKVTSDFGTLKARSEKQTHTTITLKWTKVSAADGYLIYGSKCNSHGVKYTKKYIKTIKGNKTLTWTHKNRKEATYYKYQVKAYKLVKGKKVIIAKSVEIHATTKSNKYCVAGKVQIDKLAGKKVSKTTKKLKLTLRHGRTAKIKAAEIPAETGKTIHHHRDICYESSNRKIAIVTKSGKIIAVGKGTCKIWVYAQNGVYKTITITVK